MTKTNILNGLADKVDGFPTNEIDELSQAQIEDLTYELYLQLKTNNPNLPTPPSN